jgi:hypothetical protein
VTTGRWEYLCRIWPRGRAASPGVTPEGIKAMSYLTIGVSRKRGTLGLITSSAPYHRNDPATAINLSRLPTSFVKSARV